MFTSFRGLPFYKMLLLEQKQSSSILENLFLFQLLFAPCMTTTKIVHLYQQECKSKSKVSLKERTRFRIMEMCSSSKKKSLQGLDNISTVGVEAFQMLETLVDNLARNGTRVTWGREIGRALTAGRQYLKGEYKSHLGPDEDCADHCTVYALSDPEKEQLASVRDHSHNLSCLDCQKIKKVLKDIEKRVESEELQLTEDQR